MRETIELKWIYQQVFCTRGIWVSDPGVGPSRGWDPWRGLWKPLALGHHAGAAPPFISKSSDFVRIALKSAPVDFVYVT